MTGALDEILGRMAELVHEAYELGRREALERVRSEADRLLNVDRPAPRVEVEVVRRVSATAFVTPVPEPPQTGVDVSALRPDDEPDTPREHQGLARAEAPGNALDNSRPAEAGRGDSLESSRTPAVPLEGRSDDGAAAGDKPAVSATDARPADLPKPTHAPAMPERAAQAWRAVAELVGEGKTYASYAMIAQRAGIPSGSMGAAIDTLLRGKRIARDQRGIWTILVPPPGWSAPQSAQPTEEPPTDPAPAEPAEPVATVTASSPVSPPPQPKAPATPAPDTQVDRAIARLGRVHDTVTGPVLGLWRVNGRPHSRAELLARADRIAPAAVHPPVVPNRPTPQPARTPVVPAITRPPMPSRTDEVAEIDAAIAAGKITLMPSGADLAEIMRGVPAPIVDACVDWAEKNGVKVVRGTRNSRVGDEDCPTSEIVQRIQNIARDRALDAWRARKTAERAPAPAEALA